MNTPELQRKTFLLMLIAVSLAFAWILLPFYGAVFWGSVLAIIFTPFYRKLLALMKQRPNLAALSTLLICLIAVILPVILMTVSMLQAGARCLSEDPVWRIEFRRLFSTGHE